MKLTSLHCKSASALTDVERRPVPRAAVVRRIDSKRPTRVWSLLLRPTSNLGDRK